MTAVAVLGGNGFAGQSVCRELRAAGFQVTSFSRTSGCDLLDLQNARKRLQEFAPDYIVNCAALEGSINYVGKSPADVLDINTRMILNVYKIALEIPGTIIVNPVANCGYPGNQDYLEEKRFWNGPVHPTVLGYGTTRRLMITAATCYRNQYGIRSINLITPNMYGPGDSPDPNKTHALNALVIKFVLAVRDELPSVEIWGSGRPVREWLYVEDFARLVRIAIEQGDAPTEAVNLAQNYSRTIADLAGIIKRMTGYQGEIVYNISYPDGAPRKVMFDALFRKHFNGFEFTSLESGILSTIEYYRGVL